MEESQFDVIIFGTGLVNSITAAALSKAGYKVAHIDSNAYYGGEEASLSLEELVKWADTTATFSKPASRFQRITRSTKVPSQSRQYSICLQPTVIPSLGPLISSLVSSGVAKYSGFRLLDCVSVYDSSATVQSVPGSKEDVFKSKNISLIEKRRLMRFLTFAAGDFEEKTELEGKQEVPFAEFLQKTFSLSERITSVITYALAFCMSPTEPALPTLRRLQKYLRSGGRYGPSPFLIGHYGGIGDIAQGFCRAAAVSGGVYILGRDVTSISPFEPIQPQVDSKSDEDKSTGPEKEKLAFNYAVSLENFPDTLLCNLIISPPAYVPQEFKGRVHHLGSTSTSDFKSDVASIARCIAIIDQALNLRSSEPEPQPEPTELTAGGVEGEKPVTPTSHAVPKENAIDTAVLVFPPSSVEEGSTTHSATALINGEGSLSTPSGKWLVYIALPLPSIPDESISPETLIRPYLNALLLLATGPPLTPLFTAFYLEKPAPPTTASQEKGVLGELSSSSSSSTYLVPGALSAVPLPDISDEATAIAESTFMEAMKVLEAIYPREDEDEEPIVFWPPLPVDEEEDNEW